MRERKIISNGDLLTTSNIVYLIKQHKIKEYRNTMLFSPLNSIRENNGCIYYSGFYIDIPFKQRDIRWLYDYGNGEENI